MMIIAGIIIGILIVGLFGTAKYIRFLTRKLENCYKAEGFKMAVMDYANQINKMDRLMQTAPDSIKEQYKASKDKAMNDFVDVILELDKKDDKS